MIENTNKSGFNRGLLVDEWWKGLSQQERDCFGDETCYRSELSARITVMCFARWLEERLALKDTR
jgi:hypothetical protein